MEAAIEWVIQNQLNSNLVSRAFPFEGESPGNEVGSTPARMKKPTNTRNGTGVESDVPRDCRTFKLHASRCGWEFFSFGCVCVFLCCLKSLDVKLPNSIAQSNLPCVHRFTGPLHW